MTLYEAYFLAVFWICMFVVVYVVKWACRDSNKKGDLANDRR